MRPPGIAHLEDPELTSDLTVARDFDLGMTGPPLSISMDFIANGMAEMIGGLASAVVLVRVHLVGAARARRRLARDALAACARAASGSTATRREVRAAQRDADYAYRLAVDPPASKELRLFGLAGWAIERFVDRRTTLHRLQYEATRLRERPVIWSLTHRRRRERRGVLGAGGRALTPAGSRPASSSPTRSARSACR